MALVGRALTTATMTKAELIARAEAEGLEFDPKSTKAELEALFATKTVEVAVEMAPESIDEGFTGAAPEATGAPRLLTNILHKNQVLRAGDALPEGLDAKLVESWTARGLVG